MSRKKRYYFGQRRKRPSYRWISWVVILLLGLSVVFLASLTIRTWIAQEVLPQSTGQYTSESPSSASESPSPASESPSPASESLSPTQISSLIDQMSLEEKVGQMFMIDIYGRTPTDSQATKDNLNNGKGVANFAEAIEKYHPGSFIYFNRNGNIGTPLDPKQVQDLSNGLQGIAFKQHLSIPLLLATD